MECLLGTPIILTLIHPHTGVEFRVENIYGRLIRISGSSKNPRLYIANTLLYSSHDNIGDCSIREYRSIVATITGHQASTNGSACRPTVYTYKMAYFNHDDISASF